MENIPKNIGDYKLPVDYTKLNGKERKKVRNQYVRLQYNKCMYCGGDLSIDPPTRITDLLIDWSYFPPGFLNNPIQLQHDHSNGMTEGAVHAYCNAVLWQYLRR